MIVWRTEEVVRSDDYIVRDIDKGITRAVREIGYDNPGYNVEVDNCIISNIDGRTLVTVFAKIEVRMVPA